MAKKGQIFKRHSAEFKISVILDMREHRMGYHSHALQVWLVSYVCCQFKHTLFFFVNYFSPRVSLYSTAKDNWTQEMFEEHVAALVEEHANNFIEEKKKAKNQIQKEKEKHYEKIGHSNSRKIRSDNNRGCHLFWYRRKETSQIDRRQSIGKMVYTKRCEIRDKKRAF